MPIPAQRQLTRRHEQNCHCADPVPKNQACKEKIFLISIEHILPHACAYTQTKAYVGKKPVPCALGRACPSVRKPCQGGNGGGITAVLQAAVPSDTLGPQRSSAKTDRPPGYRTACQNMGLKLYSYALKSLKPVNASHTS